jgi:hypothetical protein
MKVSSIHILGLVFGFSFLVTGMASQSGRDGDGRDRQRVCFYQDANYQGWEQCYSAGDDVTNLGNRRNAVSSIRMYGRNLRVIVYEAEGFRGQSTEFTADVPNLEFRIITGSRKWNDHIQSLQIRLVERPAPVPVVREPDLRAPHDGVCVFEHAAFQGRSYCFGVGEEIRDLARFSNWNDRISSIRVFGRAQVVVYRDSNLGGENLLVDRDVADLARLGMTPTLAWNDQISSLRVGEYRGRGRDR